MIPVWVQETGSFDTDNLWLSYFMKETVPASHIYFNTEHFNQLQNTILTMK